MTPTVAEILLLGFLGSAVFVGCVAALVIYFVDKSRSYENNRVRPERYGKIDTHYWS